MRSIARQITSDHDHALVLKGGTALLLAYGLPRFSVDLDFDANRRVSILESSVRAGATTAAIEMTDLKLRKDTGTTQRYLLHYEVSPHEPLKIEVSHRAKDMVRPEDTVIIDGIRVYKIEKLADLKVQAFLNRFNARDIYDVAFLLQHYPGAISDERQIAISDFLSTADADHLLRVLEADEIIRDYDPQAVIVSLLDRLDELGGLRENRI